MAQSHAPEIAHAIRVSLHLVVRAGWSHGWRIYPHPSLVTPSQSSRTQSIAIRSLGTTENVSYVEDTFRGTVASMHVAHEGCNTKARASCESRRTGVARAGQALMATREVQRQARSREVLRAASRKAQARLGTSAKTCARRRLVSRAQKCERNRRARTGGGVLSLCFCEHVQRRV